MKQIACVMLVDDHHPTNILHKLSIEAAGCVNKVITFTEPKVALSYLYAGFTEENPKPNIIFLDINMPGMSGWDFLEIYSNLAAESKSEILLMMLTTSTHPADLKKAEENKEVKDYIIKPLTKTIMLEIFEKYF